MTMVTFDRVDFRYDDTSVLTGISATAPRGAITAVIGPNAAGKSTLLRLVTGALRPAAGTVRVDGRAPHTLHGAALAQRIAWVPQQPSMTASFTVRDVVAFARYRRPAHAGCVERAIAAVDLTACAERAVPTLSAGQQQRVAIARAFAQLDGGGDHDGAGVLVLDEPTSALDLRHVAQLRDALRARADAGLTVIVAAHDLTTAARLADHLWLLDGGRLVYGGEACAGFDPARLEAVFGVAFQWIESDGAGPTLIAGAARSDG